MIEKEETQQTGPATSKIDSWLIRYFGIAGNLTPLAGFADHNYLVETPHGEKYTLKISPLSTSQPEIDFQISLLNHINSKDLPFSIPKVIHTLNGEAYLNIQLAEGQSGYIRLLSWVEGQMLEKANPRSSSLLQKWGQTAALLNKSLHDFDHPQAHRFDKWNNNQALLSRDFAKYLKTENQQEICHYFWTRFEEICLPRFKSLRKTVNYNDAHEHNLLVDLRYEIPEICGVIDFGDAIYSELVHELAIACAYAMMHTQDPIEAACHLIKGFHQELTLQREEIELLFDLIASRLVISVSTAAFNAHKDPENTYLQISAEPAWRLLSKMRKINPQYAHYAFRNACGFEANPSHLQFKNWMNQQDNVFTELVDFAEEKPAFIDLSVGSLTLGNNNNFNTIVQFSRTIEDFLFEEQASFAYGGYGEIRPFYTTDSYIEKGNSGARWRTVHLGLDIWGKEETPVICPYKGTIYGFNNNEGDCNYGPTIILQHNPEDGPTFWTLYGHLSLQSLSGLTIGQQFEAGEVLATFGKYPENGNWPPHLHFQIILDMLDWKDDFPGVAFPSEKEIWMSNCPNPYDLFQSMPNLSQKGKSDSEILEIRKNILGKSLSVSYKKPLHVQRGYMQHLYARDGRRYLDTVNNVAHVGHEHPSVVRSAQLQMGVLNTNSRYLHKNIIELAEQLTLTLPESLNVVHFVNSGSEANELAMRMAQAYSGSKEIAAIEVGYHGNTARCIDVSSYKFDGKGGKGKPENTYILPLPDQYRGIYAAEKNGGKKYAHHIDQIISNLAKEDKKLGCFIGESIISCGGQIVLPYNYLNHIYKSVRAQGGVCIADEVQVGFGRVGSAFWGFELQNVIPDIVTIGKPMGNGHPIAAVITTKAIAEAFANGMEYFNTFGGNPVSCAIGLSVLNTIAEEKLQKNALETGQFLKNELTTLKNKFPIIGDVRGHGLFLGFELMELGEDFVPATKKAKYLKNRMRELSILMSTDGPDENVLKIKPPLCFSKKDAQFLLENLNKVFKENYMQ